MYAIIEDVIIELPLIYTRHSEDRNVLPQLLFSDDWKAYTLGADHNNGTSQSIDLKFVVFSSNLEITGFMFEIEGNNRILKIKNKSLKLPFLLSRSNHAVSLFAA